MNRNLIQQARQVDLISFMESEGYSPKRESKDTYRIEGYGGLILKNNGFICFSEEHNGRFKTYGPKKSTNLSGNAIDFTMWFFNVSFNKAIEMLTGQALATNNTYDDTKKEHQTPLKSNAPELVLPTQAENYKRLFAYLIKTRSIDSSVIQMCLNKKLLYQDDNGNVVFLWYDSNNKIVGANLRGTLTDIEYKKNLTGNDMSNGFRIKIGTPKQLLVFEGSIDALSMLTLRPNLTDTLLIAMNCLSQLPIKKALEDYPSITKAFICVDSDEAGTNFYTNLDLKIPFQRVIPAPYKDWNEYLLNHKKIRRK